MKKGGEFWNARELSLTLDYTEWRNFSKVVDKAMLACQNSGFKCAEHFVEVNKTIAMPKGASKKVKDYQLSRYACYLIVQNGDPRKEPIALGQTYFAIQTRRQEMSEKILDHMGSEELGANLFRITQTEAKLRREQLKKLKTKKEPPMLDE